MAPPEEFQKLLSDTLAGIKNRPAQEPPRPRVLVWGSLLDNTAFYRMIEEAGAHVAADDTCIGFRLFEKDIPPADDPIEALKITTLSISSARAPTAGRAGRALTTFSKGRGNTMLTESSAILSLSAIPINLTTPI